jgi:hypothetical protein
MGEKESQQATIWIRKENLRVWKALPDKSQFVNHHLSELAKVLAPVAEQTAREGIDAKATD